MDSVRKIAQELMGQNLVSEGYASDFAKDNASRIGKPVLDNEGNEVPSTIVLSKFAYASKDSTLRGVRIHKIDPYKDREDTFLLQRDEINTLSKFAR